MELNKFWTRLFGVLGILGGITLLTGDMLFYYDPLNSNLLRIWVTHLIQELSKCSYGSLAAWFYMLGVVHVYQAFIQTKPIIKNTILICFAAITISYGVVHGAFVAIATSSKLAIENNLDLNDSVALANEANNTLRLIVYPIFGLLSILFITQVWKRKTLYPRWIILFFPLIPFLIQDFICNNLSGNIWIIVCGGYLNHILIIFFTASTIALWNKKS